MLQDMHHHIPRHGGVKEHCRAHQMLLCMNPKTRGQVLNCFKARVAFGIRMLLFLHVDTGRARLVAIKSSLEPFHILIKRSLRSHCDLNHHTGFYHTYQAICLLSYHDEASYSWYLLGRPRRRSASSNRRVRICCGWLRPRRWHSSVRGTTFP